jgi:ribosomal protein S18 acetylase RimI-like enzyme
MSSNVTEETGYDIRYSSIGDELSLRGWILTPDMRKWYPPTSDIDVEGFVRNWIGFSRYKCSLTALYNGEPVGVATIFLMPYVKVAHLSMLYIAVSPEYQRRGVGESLLKNILNLAKTKFARIESMHIEVFAGCPLIGLLRKQGFKKIVEQGNYVQLPEGFVGREIWEIWFR